ncbi:MAG TPA: type IV secretion system protein, partial [Methylotenera sp.]|nr:type IV secretion system protein [Methylotenera sp.]
MFNYIGGTFFSYIDHFVNQVSAQLSVYVAAIALSALTLYYLFVGFAVMRGEVREPISTIVWRSAKMAMILFIACGAGVYQAEVIGTVKTVSANLMSSVAVSTTGGGACPVTGTGDAAMFNALDCNFNQLLTPFNDLVAARMKLNILD